MFNCQLSVWALFLQLLARCTVVQNADAAEPVVASLSGFPGEGYSLTIGLGNPQQKFKVILDTGSSNFAIAAAPNGITSYFNSSQSSTYRSLGRSVSLEYTEGYWNGILANDDLFIMGLPGSTLVEFAGILNSKKFFQAAADWQGILGLAYPALAKPDANVIPVFDAMVRQRVVTANAFSMQLCGTVDKNHTLDISVGGKMVFDGIAKSLYRGKILYTPIVKEWFYEVLLTDIAVNGTSLGMSCSEYNNPKTIVDSGTTDLRLPTKVFNALLAQLKKNTVNFEYSKDDRFWDGSLSCCWKPEDGFFFKIFPDISLSLTFADNSSEQFTLVIPPQLYLQAVNSTNSSKDCYKFSVSPSSTGCVLGAVVMEGYYVIFDRLQKRVGFAASSCEIRSKEFAKPEVDGPMQTKNSTSCKYTLKKKAQLSTAVIVLIVVTVVVLIPASFFFVLYCCRDESDSDGDNTAESNSGFSDDDTTMSRSLISNTQS